MKMTIFLTTIKTQTEETQEACRICFRPPPFPVIEHNSCHHESSICIDCFTNWFHRNGHCDFCRKQIFPMSTKFYIVNDGRNKIYYSKKSFLKSLAKIKKKDLQILQSCLQNFKKNFNLIEKYEFQLQNKKETTIFFFKILKGGIFTTLQLYLYMCNHKNINENFTNNTCSSSEQYQHNLFVV